MVTTTLTEIYDYKKRKPTVKINNKVVTEEEYCNKLYYFFGRMIKPEIQINKKGAKEYITIHTVRSYKYYE